MSTTNVYRWTELPREDVRAGVSRTAFRGENALMVMNWLEPGMEKKPHSHPFEQLAYILAGRVRFEIGVCENSRLPNGFSIDSIGADSHWRERRFSPPSVPCQRPLSTAHHFLHHQVFR